MSQVTPTGQEAIPAPRGVRNSATRRVASTVGVFAGLLGLEHGIGETLQGNGAPGSVLINAIGPHALESLSRVYYTNSVVWTRPVISQWKV